MAGYYCKFIVSFEAVAAPLTELTKKNAPALVERMAACQQAFDSLRKALCSMPVLHNPDFTKEFIVQTDASAFAAGAVLTQTDDEGQEHPVAYFSKKFLKRERRYAAVEKECKKFLQRERPYAAVG